MNDEEFGILLPTAFEIVFAVVACIVLVGCVVTAVLIVRNFRAAKRAGIDPFTAQAEIAARLANAQMLAPAAPLEARLAELDALRAKGAISDEEHKAARAKALSG